MFVWSWGGTPLARLACIFSLSSWLNMLSARVQHFLHSYHSIHVLTDKEPFAMFIVPLRSCIAINCLEGPLKLDGLARFADITIHSSASRPRLVFHMREVTSRTGDHCHYRQH
ncbi:hypothetical protein BDW42DRAFT_63642 [Aspergillus taichungensis]|uniref:Uncharacterized protein n=1 Tax=Aspergillus taichungensis TaxID=482145 RepID=A0A2J5I112_9EURO|nr:hypothetical protein BDW42DRAFT_63642 [Aspergillus taichungensis]